MCPGCATKGLEHTDQEFEHIIRLKNIQKSLVGIATERDVHSATNAISEAVKMGIRPLDLLMGLLSPMLYQIGESWKNGTISVAEEHRFTSFCEEILVKVESLAECDSQIHGPNISKEILIVNARGNTHALGARFLALWLRDKGFKARFLWPRPPLEELAEQISSSNARILLVSIAIPEHRPAAAEVASFFATRPIQDRPRIVVGGYAVKCGLVAPIPGAELLSDISELRV